MKKNSLEQIQNKINPVWIKNFYYNRTSIQKLIFLYSFLEKKTFLEVLSERIRNCDCDKSNSIENSLIEMNDKLFNKVIISEFPFGWVWLFDSHFIYYFKNNFDFEEFYSHLCEIENSQQICWNSAEFFDKTIKILEIFKKKSFIRIYRDEEINEKTLKIKNIKKKKNQI